MLNYRTKGNADPRGKRRVYFTCHPEDMECYFDKICEDIFKTHDCAIYYTSDMSASHDENRDVDLGQMNLFVVPVTLALLTKPNRAMDEDIAFAKENNIPILPFMMQSGIEEYYSKEQKFGERQYLNPYSTDISEISYEEKLKKHLESVLISDEMAKRVRAAFDAYIFLSYRKKDRRYANELMRLIHSRPECRDIAIWYDEFLTPGESFKQNIEKMLSESKLFALLVTPNLLEDRNYVMEHEYPDAREAGIHIIPAEMEETDRTELELKYAAIPECVDPRDDIALTERLKDSLAKIAVTANDGAPEHNFLIGLAYLDGIDVEVDKERGLALITSAAEAELPEAMEKLVDMYYKGIGVKLDYCKAIEWAEKLVDIYTLTEGKEGRKTLTWINNLAVFYGESGDYKKALELKKEVYALYCRIFGEDHPNTLIALSNLAVTRHELGEHKIAFELDDRVYNLGCRVLGEDHPLTLIFINNLASAYGHLNDYKKALELKEKVYDLGCRIFGEEHPATLTFLNNLANAYGELGEHKKALELKEKVYDFGCRIFGESHPETLKYLNNYALTCNALGDHTKALELNEKVYGLGCSIFGEEHPMVLTSMNNLASAYSALGNYNKALELDQKVYDLSCRILGREHPDTLKSLSNLGYTYDRLKEYEKALELQEQAYAAYQRILGEDNTDTLTALNNLAVTYGHLGDYAKALSLHEKIYTSRCRLFGDEHPSTLLVLNNLAFDYGKLGDHRKALILNEKAYEARRRILGEDHWDTIVSLGNLADTYGALGDFEKRDELALEGTLIIQRKFLEPLAKKIASLM